MPSSLSAAQRPSGPGGRVRALWFWPCVGAFGLLLVVASISIDRHGFLEIGPSPWRAFVTVPGHMLALLAWFKMGSSWPRPRLVLALWTLILLFSPPLHSRDAFSYAAQGWLMTHGLDPYTVASGDAGQAGLLVGIHWFRTTSVYPPLSLEIFGVVSQLFGGDLYWSAIGMRLPNLLALAFLVWCLPRLAARVGIRRNLVLWAGLLNPVMLVQWVGGIHNDAIMVALLAAAFLVAQQMWARGWLAIAAGGAFIGLAMAIKQSAAVAGVGMVALAWASAQPLLPKASRTWWAIERRAAVGGAAAVGTFALVSWATGLGMGWRNPTAGSPLQATSNAPISWVASFARFHELLSDGRIISSLTLFTAVLIIAGIVVLVWKLGPRPPDDVGQPWLLVCGLLLAFAVLGPALQPWYLTWIIPFVALAQPGLRMQHAFVVVTFVCALLAPLQDVMAPYWALGFAAVPSWFLWRGLRLNETSVFAADKTLV